MQNQKTMKMRYQEHDINDILKYFVDGFKCKPGQKIENWEANYDPRKGKVIFTLFVNDKARESAS